MEELNRELLVAKKNLEDSILERDHFQENCPCSETTRYPCTNCLDLDSVVDAAEGELMEIETEIDENKNTE